MSPWQGHTNRTVARVLALVLIAGGVYGARLAAGSEPRARRAVAFFCLLGAFRRAKKLAFDMTVRPADL